MNRTSLDFYAFSEFFLYVSEISGPKSHLFIKQLERFILPET